MAIYLPSGVCIEARGRKSVDYKATVGMGDYIVDKKPSMEFTLKAYGDDRQTLYDWWMNDLERGKKTFFAKVGFFGDSNYIECKIDNDFEMILDDGIEGSVSIKATIIN